MSQKRNQRRKPKQPGYQLQKILVVDDDAIIRDMMVDILESEGYTPELARNGQEALQILSRQAGYLVFLDLMMPTFNGKEVCAALAARPQIRQQHVLVLMSAMDNIEETYALDIDMIMSKPFVVDDVNEILEEYMRQ